MDLTRLNVRERVALVAMLGVVLGAFLPWVTWRTMSVTGFAGGDGKLTLGLAVVGVIVLLASSRVFRLHGAPSIAGQVALIVCAGLVVFIALYDMSSFAAIGIYLTSFGGIAWLVASAWDLVVSRSAVATPTVSVPPSAPDAPPPAAPVAPRPPLPQVPGPPSPPPPRRPE